jgi:hypothetical protein
MRVFRLEIGSEVHLVREVYTILCHQGFRVFWEPACIPSKSVRDARDREDRYLRAASSSAVAVVFISRHSFSGPDYDMKRYVWSSTPDDLLLEWDLLLELHDRGLLRDLLPCLVGDATAAAAAAARDRFLARLGIASLTEAALARRARDIFRFVDADASGAIDGDELPAALRRFGLDLPPAALAALARRADADADGTIDEMEFQDLVRLLLEAHCGIAFPSAAARRPAAAPPPAAAAAPAAAAEEEEVTFSNFSESGCLPELPAVVLSQGRATIVRWLRRLHLPPAPVLWRAPHCRAVPGADGAGRTVRATAAAAAGFPTAHAVVGPARAAPARAAEAAARAWAACAAVPPQRWVEGARPRRITCLHTRQPARLIDPITQAFYPLPHPPTHRRGLPVFNFDPRR